MKLGQQIYLKLAAIPVAAALLGIATVALAQPRQPSPDQPRAGRPQQPPGAFGRFGPGFERVMGVLTDEQRSSLREIIEGQRAQMRELEEKLRDARKDLLEAGLSEKFDEEGLRHKAMAAARLEAEMTVLRAKAFSQLRPRLSADQIEKIKKAPLRGPGEGQDEPSPRRRPSRERDENGLPPKDRSSEQPNQAQQPAPK